MSIRRFGPAITRGLALASFVAATCWSTIAMSQLLVRLPLPEPRADSGVSIEEALRSRRSVREFTAAPLTLAEISQVLWAGQGVTDPRGHRTAPSAGALYPLALYLVVGEITTIEPGVYRYDPPRHELLRTGDGDRRAALSAAAFGQTWIGQAAAILVIAATRELTATRYGARAERYVDIEAGHAAENIYLQAFALGLATVDVGAFDDASIKTVAGLREAEDPVLILPIGRPVR